MKVIFLDMDGVINSNSLIRKYLDEQTAKGLTKEEVIEKYKKKYKSGKELIFPELWDRLKEILSATGAKIVWTSTWRTIPEYQRIEDGRKLFEKYGIPGETLVGYTPEFRVGIRGREIHHFLKNHNLEEPIERSAILDDRWDADCDIDHIRYDVEFFETNVEYGLTEEIKKAVIKYLNEGAMCDT